jgi:hypothetical protein
MLGGESECRFATFCFAHCPAEFFEQGAGEQTIGRMVVNDQGVSISHVYSQAGNER